MSQRTLLSESVCSGRTAGRPMGHFGDFNVWPQWARTAAMICLCLAGCSGPADKCRVRGVVTWNGDPIKIGFVTFKPVDGRYGPEAGPIRDGKFDFLARPGKNRVEILATKEVGFDDFMNQPILVQFAPPEYNEESTLEEVVSVDGDNSFEFHLVGDEQ